MKVIFQPLFAKIINNARSVRVIIIGGDHRHDGGALIEGVNHEFA